jgi:hypothetical protein
MNPVARGPFEPGQALDISAHRSNSVTQGHACRCSAVDRDAIVGVAGCHCFGNGIGLGAFKLDDLDARLMNSISFYF